MVENIFFQLSEKNKETDTNNDFDINKLVHELDNIIIQESIDKSEIEKYCNWELNYYDYEFNCTIKQLLMICDYYDITKKFQLNKKSKDIIISKLVDFENDPENNIIVVDRKKYWFYMTELKRDKFMKKYILWNI
jgi:hypothetical protein